MTWYIEQQDEYPKIIADFEAKKQFEAEMTRVAKDKTELEQAFLRGKTEWEQEKLKMTGEMVKLRRAAQITVSLIEQILKQKGPEPQLYNLNIPTVACQTPSRVKIVPMGVARYGENFIKRLLP